MRADTQTIAIDAAPADVYRFVADPANLPRWAVGFAKSIRRESDHWVVSTGAREIALRVRADDPETGVVDFVMRPPGGNEAIAASRVLARGRGAEYVFTQFQQPGMSDEVFEKSVAAVRHELAVLKALLEVDCPA